LITLLPPPGTCTCDLSNRYQTTDTDDIHQNKRHELYCAGHLIEAAIAHYTYSSSPVLLNALTGYVDLINKTFGHGFRQRRGYPGHQGIELALLRLYELTGRKEDLRLARFFIEERGKVDERGENYFDKETRVG
jgi:uncharacterized protein